MTRNACRDADARNSQSVYREVVSLRHGILRRDILHVT